MLCGLAGDFVSELLHDRNLLAGCLRVLVLLLVTVAPWVS